MANETYLNQTQQLLPEYQESFLKSLLFSAFDPYGGYITDAAGNRREGRQGDALGEGESFVSQPTGLATESPLSTVPEQTLAKFGYTDPQTGEVSYSGFTPAQSSALQMGIGQIGGYQPMFDSAAQTFGQGLGTYGEAVDMARLGGSALQGTAAEYDPQSYQSYYDPFVEEVIGQTQQDISDQQQRELSRVRAGAVGAGAFGGSRGAVAEQELARNTMREQARVGSQLRSQAYGQAQQQAQGAFESAQQRGQNASQLYGQLGQGLGSLGQGMFGAGTTQMAAGEAAQAAGSRDTNALFNLGTLEQSQAQAELDVQRGSAMENAYEPYQRLGFLSDIFRGVPTLSGSMTAGLAPTKNPTQTFLGYGMGLSGLQQGGGGGLFS
jgi:hypothetical protein